MKKIFLKHLPAKLAFALFGILASYFDADFKDNTWAQIIAGLVLFIVFFGEVLWQLLSNSYKK